MMKQTKTVRWILASAVLGCASVAMAQNRIGNDGHALDANNRVGSGGLNDSGASGGASVNNNQLNNQIVNGTVTGGKQFRGFVPYSDPNVFEGSTATSNFDRFVRSSSGAPISGVPQNNAQVVQPFYGNNSVAPSSPGFVRQSIGSGGYIPAPSAQRQEGDMRLGETLNTPQTSLPAPGQLILPGPVDPKSSSGSVITASPLYGSRQWDLNDQSNLPFLDRNPGGTTARTEAQQSTIQKYREELTDNGDSQNGQQLAPYEQPGSDAVRNSTPLNSQLQNANPNQIAANNLSTGQSLSGRRKLIGPDKQSTQYSELQQRLQQYQVVQSQPENDASNKRGKPIEKGKENSDGKSIAQNATDKPDTAIARPTPSPAAKPSPLPQPNQPKEMTPAPAPIVAGNRPAPLQIHSLADGVKAKGLGDLLREAETQMKAHHYNSALEQYEMAEQVAPNNPLILLGRANAELGQSYYTRAETHLRQAFMQDQALLMGQYDLQGQLGQDRVEYLVSDLKQIAKSENKESRPLLLLAYIAYNTGNEPRAAAYLDLAEKRAGNDPIYPLLRKYWALPQTQPNGADELNK